MVSFTFSILYMKKIIIASTSTLYGSGYLEYLLNELSLFFKHSKTIVFVPYARPSGILHDDYTQIAAKAFAKLNKTVTGLHTFKDPKKAILDAEGIFVGGGNTFVLLNQLYQLNILTALKQHITHGVPYLGTSAGSNICGLSIKTTNDMPVVYPPSFNALGLVPFNLNPHYLDPIKNTTHMGETRETRIKEFHIYNTQPVVGLREGSWLHVEDTNITLKGIPTARIFEQNKLPYEVETGTQLNGLN